MEKDLAFGISRGEMLSVLAGVLLIPRERDGAFLGKFQHLQRLSLIDGINPGRGKNAQYSAYQMAVIAIAFQFLQLGITPERTVRIMKEKRRSIEKSLARVASIEFDQHGMPVEAPDWRYRSFLKVDPAALSDIKEPIDMLAYSVEPLTGQELRTLLDEQFLSSAAQRFSAISVSSTIGAIGIHLDLDMAKDPETFALGPKGLQFFKALYDWAVEEGLLDGDTEA
ncbi:hypothetical protein [Croceicoccus marinus]|uniref:Uncharacterized protein n=1 Tax=Croceicoccus marinus TaxID=450378 RepID=A0A7G6VUJ4_9SPHN|nr:hypothetical protein [Croceicoccus marinus]QNE05409.1 hypothetical protein H4O24_01475 [Croceicoccus marinus]